MRIELCLAYMRTVRDELANYLEPGQESRGVGGDDYQRLYQKVLESIARKESLSYVDITPAEWRILGESLRQAFAPHNPVPSRNLAAVINYIISEVDEHALAAAVEEAMATA